MGTAGEKIGTVERVMRYPVKSMAGEELPEVFVQFTGLMGDRVWAFVQSKKDAEGNNFPWHSAREQEDLLLYRPRFDRALDPGRQYPNPSDFAISVTTPRGTAIPVDSPDLLAELQGKAGGDIFLRFSEKGQQDARPVALFGRATVAGLSEEVGFTLDELRFRANFYVRWEDDTPFKEDGLVGKSLKIGDTLELAIVKKDPRCKIITLDPQTAEARPEVLRTVAKKHGGCCGVYGAVLREGLVKAGDAIALV